MCKTDGKWRQRKPQASFVLCDAEAEALQTLFLRLLCHLAPVRSCPQLAAVGASPVRGRRGQMCLMRPSSSRALIPAAAEHSTSSGATLLWAVAARCPQAQLCSPPPCPYPATRGSSQEDSGNTIAPLLFPQSWGRWFLQLLVFVLPWCPFLTLSVFLHVYNWSPILNPLPEICRMVSVCWLNPGLIEWNWKVKGENAPALSHIAKTGAGLLPICSEVHFHQPRGHSRATYPHGYVRIGSPILTYPHIYSTVFHQKFTAGKVWGVVQVQHSFHVGKGSCRFLKNDH